MRAPFPTPEFVQTARSLQIRNKSFLSNITANGALLLLANHSAGQASPVAEQSGHCASLKGEFWVDTENALAATLPCVPQHSEP